MDQEQNTAPKYETFPTATSPEKSDLSMFVGVGAFVIIIVGLGWYIMQGGALSGDLLGQTPATPTIRSQNSASISTSTEDAATAALSTQGTSDEVTDINADLKATDLNSLNDVNKI